MKSSLRPSLFTNCLLTLCLYAPASEPIRVDVGVNMRHTVGGVSEFQREKLITIHAAFGEKDWLHNVRGEGNFTDDLLTDFFEGYDVYLGRDTGYITGQLKHSTEEDPDKPGWPLLSAMKAHGEKSRNQFGKNTAWDKLEHRAQSDMICTQFHPFWPDGTQTENGWALSQADTSEEPFGSATGFYVAHFLNEYFATEANGGIGRPQPALLEIINEPDWELWKLNAPTNTTDPDRLWTFHNSVADQVRRLCPDVKVGGFCNSFPDHQYGGFEEWDKEWRAFIDACGKNMDFYTLHLYGFQDKYTYWERMGCNIEATLDLIEHYSDMQVGRPLPFVVSEYGARARDIENNTWSSLRDWKYIRSMNSMLMTFADRPHLIEKVIPFVLCKAEWGRGEEAYPWRLMRQANEPESGTGEWVYTDFIKFYDLWKDVRGTRVQIESSDPDLQVDAYVDGDRVSVVLHNLERSAQKVRLNLEGLQGNVLKEVVEKNIYLSSEEITTLDKHSHAEAPAEVTLQALGTAVLTYRFADEVRFAGTTEEVKHYATEYMKPIRAGLANTFKIRDVRRGRDGRAILRLGIGRDKALSRHPVVLVNGKPVNVRNDFMGNDLGDERPIFFGVLDIPVPYELLKKTNKISVTFGDEGGHIASVALRAFEVK